MGSAGAQHWLPPQDSNNHQSGVHSLNDPPQPLTKSDRVPALRSKHPTLASFASAPPPQIDTDDKRWIGSHADQGFSTTQRTFSAPPPATDANAAVGKTLQISPGHGSFGQTLRAVSVPPPAQGATPKPISSNPPPPIKPARTINISPEIAIPSARAADPGPAPRAPLPPPKPSAPPQARELPGKSPELPPTSKAKTSAQAGEPLPGGVSTRWLAIGLGIAVVAITAIVVLTMPSAPEPQHVVTPAAGTATATPPSHADVRPSTEIITNPPGAEIVLRGALVANTPAHVVRPSYEALYLVRLRGHQPQLVALSPHSPDTIRIELHPTLGEPTAEPLPDQGAAPASEPTP